MVDIKRYGNYLTMNNHKPLLRFQFKEHFLQRDYFKKEEEKHLEKLQMALHYIKELNHKKAVELEDYEQKIKSKIDDRATAIGEKYKVHL